LYRGHRYHFSLEQIVDGLEESRAD